MYIFASNLFTSTENYASNLFFRLILSKIVDTHEDTCASHMYEYPSIPEREDNYGYCFSIEANLCLAYGVELPISVAVDLETEVLDCVSTFKEEYPDEMTVNSNSHFEDYLSNWLEHYRYFYNFSCKKDKDTGLLSVECWLNPNGFNKGSFFYGHCHFTLPVNDSMTEEEVFSIVNATVDKVLETIWEW